MEHKNKSNSENFGGDGTYVVKSDKKVNILAFAGCLIIAFFVWVYVMNIKMTDNTKTFSINLDIKGENSLYTETGYSVFGEYDHFVKVTVQGTKADLMKYSENDFKAYVDISSVDQAGITPLNIVVETPSVSISIVSIDPVVANVMIDENVEEKPINISAYTTNVDADIRLALNETLINVSGPKTYIDKIAYAKISVNAGEDDINSEYKTFSEVAFYDEKDNPITSSYFIYDTKDIVVTVLAKEEAN